MGKDEIIFGYYSVVFLDLLNQKEILASTDTLPSDEKEMIRFKNKLKNTYGKIAAFRSLYDNFYEGYSQASINSPLYNISNLFPQMKPYRGWTVKKHYFSDTVVYYSPLGKSNDYFGINNIYSLIAPIASLQLFTLAAETVFRGGIEVGIAGEYFENEIYGNALYNAYRLEDKVAQYPRVVVGMKLYEYIIGESKIEGNDDLSKYRRALSRACLDFIRNDYDGELVINPVCNAVKQMAGSCFFDVHAKALLFVKNEVLRFRNTNQLFYERYQKLENLISP